MQITRTNTPQRKYISFAAGRGLREARVLAEQGMSVRRLVQGGADASVSVSSVIVNRILESLSDSRGIAIVAAKKRKVISMRDKNVASVFATHMNNLRYHCDDLSSVLSRKAQDSLRYLKIELEQHVKLRRCSPEQKVHKPHKH
jgi:hypothetical protein